MAAYEMPILTSTVTQRVIYAEAAAQGKAVFEIDTAGPAAAEIAALVAEILEFAK
ncbi:hypothetical protein [Morganella morganii IS15]|nr:hypothetical protein [Morganella morganii IS15]